MKAKKTPAAWDMKQRQKLEIQMLFDEPIKLEKIPFEFRFVWIDADGTEHDSLVISWEMAQTWRNYKKRYPNPLAVMEDKLLGDMFADGKDVSFFMGNHSRFRQTFMVCGWFVPPSGEASSDFLF